MQAPRLIQGALGQAVPGARRPALRNRQPENVVGLVIVAFNVQSARTLGRQGEDLQRNVAVGETRDVNLSVGAAFEQVAAPEQRVGVQIDDGELSVKGARWLRCGVGRLPEDFILSVIHQLRNGEEECRYDARDHQKKLNRPAQQNLPAFCVVLGALFSTQRKRRRDTLGGTDEGGCPFASLSIPTQS